MPPNSTSTMADASAIIPVLSMASLAGLVLKTSLTSDAPYPDSVTVNLLPVVAAALLASLIAILWIINNHISETQAASRLGVRQELEDGEDLFKNIDTLFVL